MVCAYPGIVIVGEDTVGRYDLGIFVASIVPGGPADKDGRIRPGRKCGNPALRCAAEVPRLTVIFGGVSSFPLLLDTSTISL